jgi:hypothetical protein
MTFSLAGTIDHIAARLPHALIAPAALGRVRRLAESFPASLTSWIDLECRLRAGDPQVDLSVRIDARGRQQLAQHSGARLPSHAVAWQRVAAFAQAWADPATATYRCVAAVWLEFDLAEGADPASVPPRMFIDLARHAGGAADGVGPIGALGTVMAALAPVVGPRIPEWLRGGVGRCLEALPPSAELLYVGLPVDERLTSLRLCVLGLNERHCAEYLGAVDCQSHVSSSGRALGTWRGRRRDHAVRGAMLHLDLDDRGRVGSRLGLEYPLRRRPQVMGVIADTDFLAELVACGVCTPDKRDAILAWPGCEVATLPHEIWPSLVMRRVSHVKVVSNREAPPEAKAYLCFAHAPRLAAGVRRPPLFVPAPIAS